MHFLLYLPEGLEPQAHVPDGAPEIDNVAEADAAWIVPLSLEDLDVVAPRIPTRRLVIKPFAWKARTGFDHRKRDVLEWLADYAGKKLSESRDIPF